MRYIVMLNLNKRPVPMLDEHDDDKVALFDTELEAEEAAMENIIGRAHGYEVYHWEF